MKPDAAFKVERTSFVVIIHPLPHVGGSTRRRLSLNNLNIRKAKRSDAEAISHLVNELAHYFLADPSSDSVQSFLATLTPQAMAERIGAPNFCYYVAEDSSGLRGVICLRDGSHLYHLFVKTGSHKQGLARALWNHAKLQSDASVFTVNSSLFAVPVYERLGFVATNTPQTQYGVTFVPMLFNPVG